MRYIPSPTEIVIFALLALFFAALVMNLRVSAHDLGLSFFALPLFIFAAVMGLRRNWSAAEDE